MPEYKELSKTELCERLLSLENPIIMMHRRPDGDAIGSASALSVLLKMLGKDAPIISCDKIPERLKFIVDYTDTTVKASLDGYTPITIDVASPDQLGSFKERANDIRLMIDHHIIGERFADSYIIPEASSAAEVLYDAVVEFEKAGKISLTRELAYPLYAAISSDTGSFRYSNTSKRTHEIAAALVATGIDTADINHRLFMSKSKNTILAEGFASVNMKTDLDGKIAYTALTRSDMQRLGLCDEDTESIIDVVRSLSGVEVAFVVKELSDGSFRASLRSTGLDVASICHTFGGGGHTRAAGCTPKTKTIDETVTILLERIKHAFG